MQSFHAVHLLQLVDFDISRGFGRNNLQIVIMKQLKLKTDYKLDKSSVFTVSDVAAADLARSSRSVSVSL